MRQNLSSGKQAEPYEQAHEIRSIFVMNLLFCRRARLTKKDIDLAHSRGGLTLFLVQHLEYLLPGFCRLIAGEPPLMLR